MKNTTITLNDINRNDTIYIMIYDTGEGYATVIDKTENELTIEVDLDDFVCCYNGHLVSPILHVNNEEIAELHSRCPWS